MPYVIISKREKARSENRNKTYWFIIPTGE
jgi:hypothetical protein